MYTTNSHIHSLVYDEELQAVKIAYLGTGNSVGFEIFEFEDPKYDSVSTDPFVNRYTSGGFFHIAITAPEPEELTKYVLKGSGRQIGETVQLSNGETAAYVQDPWGNVIEIVSVSFERLLLAGKI